MTRGTIFYISSNETMYETCEFNGDMYPDGCAEFLIEKYERGDITNAGQFTMFVQKFNGKYFGYDDETDSLITPWLDKRVFNHRIARCKSDFAYVINETDEPLKVGLVTFPAHALSFVQGDTLVIIRSALKEFYINTLTQNISDLVLRAYNNDECPLSERELVGILDEVQRRFIEKM